MFKSTSMAADALWAKGGARLTRLALVGGLCLALGGCFDLKHTLTVSGDGTGSFAVMMRTDPAFQDARDEDQILPPQKSPVEISRGVRDGQYVQEEKTIFNSLDKLQVQNEDLSITNQGNTFFGLGPKRLTLIRRMENNGAEDDFGVMRNLFQDRTYTFIANLPGWIDQAYPVEIGEEIIEPTIRGSTVMWEIPMGRAVSVRSMEFRVDFRAYYKIEAVSAAKRLEDSLLQVAPGLGAP